jgi:hypothetical protein
LRGEVKIGALSPLATCDLAGAGEQPQNERREVAASAAVIAVTVAAESVVAIAASGRLIIAVPLPTEAPVPTEPVVAVPADLVTIALTRHLSQ